MPWWKPKPSPGPQGGALPNLNDLPPRLAAILKTFIGKLDLSDLDAKERDAVIRLYNALPGVAYTLIAKGMFNDYGAPIERIKAIRPDTRRK
ncbi:hypothetical protein D3C75_730160 [compost metagenome]